MKLHRWLFKPQVRTLFKNEKRSMRFLESLFARQLVGLDIGVSGIKAVEISGTKNPRLMAYNRIALPWDTLSPEGEIRKPDYLIEALRKLFALKNFSTKKVAVGAFGNAILTKKITVPKMSHEELSHQLYWEAEQYIPFNVNEVNLDFAMIGDSKSQSTGKPMMDVLLVAAKKDFVTTLKNTVEEAGLQVEVIDNQSFALGNSFEFNYGYKLQALGEALPTNAIVDFGAGSTKVCVVEGDKTTFARELRQSGIVCTQLIAGRLSIELEEAEQLKTEANLEGSAQDVVYEFNQTLSDEISRTLDYFLSQNPESSIQKVYTCGGAARLKGLRTVLAERLSIAVEPLNPLQNVSGSGRAMNREAILELKELGTVATGLSLRRAGDGR